jgi:hypothetical protein
VSSLFLVILGMHPNADPAGRPLKMTSDRVMQRQTCKKTVDKPFTIMLENAVQED